MRQEHMLQRAKVSEGHKDSSNTIKGEQPCFHMQSHASLHSTPAHKDKIIHSTTYT